MRRLGQVKALTDFTLSAERWYHRRQSPAECGGRGSRNILASGTRTASVRELRDPRCACHRPNQQDMQRAMWRDKPLNALIHISGRAGRGTGICRVCRARHARGATNQTEASARSSGDTPPRKETGSRGQSQLVNQLARGALNSGESNCWRRSRRRDDDWIRRILVARRLTRRRSERVK